MADIKKYLSLERLAEYDALLKAKIAQGDAAVLDAAKEYVDQKFDGHTHSWNELTDKPFGEERGILFTVAEYQELTLDRTFTTDKLCAYINTTDNSYHSKGIPSGQYLVVFDGESYIVDNLEVKAINNLPANLIGNPYLGNGELRNGVDYEDNGLPFLILWAAGGRPCALYAADSTVAHTIEVHAIGNQTKCIDEKYFPDTIARKSDLDASITNITNGDIVVKEAEHATSADSAITADSATSAESATKATQDGNGAVIADTYETKSDASAKLDEAKEYTDTLKTYVGTIPEGATATDVVAYIQEKTSGIASEGAMTELSNRVGIVEGKVATIEGDYLTSADKTELQTNIDTVSSAVELLTNGVDAETVDGVNDLIAYVNEHGAEVTGMKADIKANADALAELAPVAKTGSWNDLADKPFGDEGTGVTIEWDGNTEGRDNFAFENGVVWYKVSDATPSVEELAEAKMTLAIDGTPMDYPLDQVMTTGEGYIGMGEIGFVVTQTPFVYNDITREAPSTGIYWQTTGEGFSASLTYGGSSSIKTLDEKYIPASIARVADQYALASRVTTAESDIGTLEGKVGTMETDLDAVEAKASANETAIGNLNTAVAGKAAQGDLDSAVERVAVLETWHEGFEEITAEDINGLFA